MSFRVALSISNPGGGTDWYRASGPLGHLQRTSHVGFDFHTFREASTTVASLTDLAFVQRPTTYQELNTMRIFRRCGVPVIVDYDDDYLSVPSDNPNFFRCCEKETVESVVMAWDEASAVLVTTPHLAQRVLRVSPHQRVFVVPNALDERLHCDGEGVPKPKTETILWRGSGSHQRDLYTFRDELKRFLHRRVEQHYTFMGYYPWFLDLPKAQYKVIAPNFVVPEYLANLRRISPKFGIVPLDDSEFNRSKSNIAWLELAASGAVVLAPKWPEWQHPGVVHYDAERDFVSQLAWLVDCLPESLHEMRVAQWTAIQERFTLAKVNRLREQIFLAALGKGEWPAQEKPAPTDGVK